jgi:CheY-like chemotaxis protein
VPGEKPRSQRVLVVDDNEDVAESLRELLEARGYEARAALSGRQALELAPAFVPDTVICDMKMPEMNGAQVCAALRADPRLAASRLIILSGSAAEDGLLFGNDGLGLSAYLLKPVPWPTLEAAIRLPGCVS